MKKLQEALAFSDNQVLQYTIHQNELLTGWNPKGHIGTTAVDALCTHLVTISHDCNRFRRHVHFITVEQQCVLVTHV